MVPAVLVVNRDGEAVDVRYDAFHLLAGRQLYVGRLLYVLRIKESGLQLNRRVSRCNARQNARSRMAAGAPALSIEEFFTCFGVARQKVFERVGGWGFTG